MDGYAFTLAGADLVARGSGALYWPAQSLLCVSDLHLGKAERMARRGIGQMPPYETRDTLTRLDDEIEATRATTIICLGDSFDDTAAAEALSLDDKLWISRMQAGRRWVWIEGNHDPGPVDLGGAHLAALPLAPLTFAHEAKAANAGEVSGHYHPKATLAVKGRSVTRPCFLLDSDRLIMPAFGTYTGGLQSHAEVLSTLMRPEALAILTGPTPSAMPMPRT